MLGTGRALLAGLGGRPMREPFQRVLKRRGFDSLLFANPEILAGTLDVCLLYTSEVDAARMVDAAARVAGGHGFGAELVQLFDGVDSHVAGAGHGAGGAFQIHVAGLAVSYTHLFFTIGMVSNFHKLMEEGIGRLAIVYVVCLFGFIIWLGLFISWLFFHGMTPPVIAG